MWQNQLDSFEKFPRSIHSAAPRSNSVMLNIRLEDELFGWDYIRIQRWFPVEDYENGENAFISVGLFFSFCSLYIPYLLWIEKFWAGERSGSHFSFDTDDEDVSRVTHLPQFRLLS